MKVLDCIHIPIYFRSPSELAKNMLAVYSRDIHNLLELLLN